MAIKSTINVYENEQKWLSRHGNKRTEQLRTDIETLRRTGQPPALTDAESGFLRDILNGFYYVPEQVRSLPFAIAVAIEDGARLDGMAAKWKVDAAKLADKVRGLHPADAWALVDDIICLASNGYAAKN